MTDDYDGSQVLFRQAKARTLAARRFATEAEQEKSLGRHGIERTQRERDAVIVVLILTQGAAEGYANWVHLQAETKVNGSWVNRWEKLTDAAKNMKRSAEFALGNDHRAFLNELGAWRNYLLHADARARIRLRELLANDGRLTEGLSEPDLLTADLAESTLHLANQLFRWAQDQTGIQAPFLDSVWVAPDEC